MALGVSFTEPMPEPEPTEIHIVANDGYVTNLINNIHFLRENAQFIDAILICADGSELPFHRLILASSNCPYFTQLLLSNPAPPMVNYPIRIQLPNNLRGYCMDIILYFIYTGNVEMPQNTDEVKELLATSRFLELDEFNKQMASVLVRSLTVDNYTFVWDLADEYDIHILRNEVVSYVTKDLPLFLSLPEFLSFDVSRVKLLLASPDVNGHPQKLLQGVIEWLKRDFATREKEIGHLIKHVKFCKLSKPFLRTVIKTEPMVQECQELWRAIAATLYSRGVQLENYDPERDNVAKAIMDKVVENGGQEEGGDSLPVMTEQSVCNGEVKPKKSPSKEVPKLPPKKPPPAKVYTKPKMSAVPPTPSTKTTTKPLMKTITVKMCTFAKSTV